MSKLKPLTLEELKYMDGVKVFTVPIVINKSPRPTFDPYYSGLCFHRVDIDSGKIINNDGGFWNISKLNNLNYGFLAFKEAVSEEEVLKIWEELIIDGMVSY